MKYFLHYFFAPLSHLPRNAFIIKMVYAESSILLTSRVCTAGSAYLVPVVLAAFYKMLDQARENSGRVLTCLLAVLCPRLDYLSVLEPSTSKEEQL